MTFWSRQLSILLSLSSTGHIKRQVNTQIPTQCNAACNNAALQAQIIGKTPALCATGGSFEVDLSSCTQCLLVNSNGGNTTQLSQLNQFVTYCDEVNSGEFASYFTSALIVLASASLQAAALSRSSASLASVVASADSVVGITVNSLTVTTTSSYTSSSSISSSSISSSSSTLSTPRATKTTSPTPIPNHKSNFGTIIGAAVGGSIGGIILIGLIIGFIIMRRRDQRKAIIATSQQPENPHEPTEKAQLHSDDYKPHREELLGTLGKKQYDHTAMSELPSNEPVEKTKELPVNEEVGAELDNRVKIPKKVDESSQSTKVGSGSDHQTNL